MAGAPTFTKPGIHKFQHDQAFSSATWTVTHNLGRKPTFDVFLDSIHPGTVEKALPKYVTYPNDNTMVLTFSFACTGRAVLS
jgi:hypothetical protein